MSSSITYPYFGLPLLRTVRFNKQLTHMQKKSIRKYFKNPTICETMSCSDSYSHFNKTNKIKQEKKKQCVLISFQLVHVTRCVLLDSIQTNLNMSGAIILTAFVNPIVLIPLTFLSVMFWFVLYNLCGHNILKMHLFICLITLSIKVW